MSKCFVDYIESDDGTTYWRCLRFSASSQALISDTRDKCYFHNCKGRYPQKKVCAWKDCVSEVAPNKLRHCSEICRKRDNRYAYKQRQKLKKN
jgi:hypothetical protein